MSDTPRTDTEEYDSNDLPECNNYCVDVEFSRQLERELAAMTAERDRLQAALKQCRNCLSDIAAAESGGLPWGWDWEAVLSESDAALNNETP